MCEEMMRPTVYYIITHQNNEFRMGQTFLKCKRVTYYYYNIFFSTKQILKCSNVQNFTNVVIYMASETFKRQKNHAVDVISTS